MKQIIISLAFLLIPSYVWAQPLPCPPNINYWAATTDGATLKICTSDGSTWLSFYIPTVPSGSIVLVSSGTCPTGYTEATELNGKTLVGTLAANKDVGNTGGADNITPAGTNSALTFTGAAITFTEVINHTHVVTSVGSAATGGTTNLTGASDTSSTTATAANPSGGVASFQKTPTGTINTPTFTGTQFDNRSAYVKVIFCKKT